MDFNLIDNIVIMDDLSGTGKTITKYIDSLHNRYPFITKHKKIYIMLIECTEQAENRISDFGKNIT